MTSLDSAAIQRLRSGCHTTMYEDSDGVHTNIKNVQSQSGNTLSLDGSGNLVAVDGVTCDPGAHLIIGTETTGGL